MCAATSTCSACDGSYCDGSYCCEQPEPLSARAFCCSPTAVAKDNATAGPQVGVISFVQGGSGGKLELRDQLQLWYYPPQPSLVYHQAPTPLPYGCSA
ncbi:hypothetical protein D4764_0262190 [Takifugu flavidus]|uniref:Uncharacterized protein n=1 Tax=Takifugu flavidus TaxID=433684 RepID=A0A5C6MHQ4_9TELE|nr:hypothetical protein D4764_0262190 [Takifugu flavidus]